jgi:hypothetical protein
VNVSRIVHDVAKYVARTARNLPDGPVEDAELRAMLARDLYALPGGRASAVLAALAAPARGDARVAEASRLLAEADRLEAAIARGDCAAAGRAAAIARRVEALLRSLVANR